MIKGNSDKEQLEFMPINIIINKINFIKYIYEIKKDDIGKDIQKINNEILISSDKNEEILKEIKVIINGEIKSNILTNKFNIEGNYIIYFYPIIYSQICHLVQRLHSIKRNKLFII